MKIKLYTQEIYGSCFDCPWRRDQDKESLCTNSKRRIPRFINNILYPIPKWCPLPDVEDEINVSSPESNHTEKE
jgi:hypothetical protein